MATAIHPATPNGHVHEPHLDRRAFPRHRSRRPARWRLADKPFAPQRRGQLVDASQGGICLTTPVAPGLDDVVEIEVDGPSQALRLVREAEVRWVVPDANGGFRVGCQWMQRLTYADLQRII